MSRTLPTKLRRSLLVAGSALLLLSLAAPVAEAAPPPFTMTVSPSSVAAGTGASFTATFTNRSGVVMGSANLLVPTAFTVTGVTTTRGTATLVGNTVQLRGLALAPLESFTVVVTATSTCVRSNVPVRVWNAAAWTGSNGTGTAFRLTTPSNQRSTQITGACSLAFIEGRQPADAETGEGISAAPGDPDGPPVQVGIFNPSNQLVTVGPSITISMAIGNNPGLATLGGDTSVPTAGGIATFGDLTLDEPGTDYTLVASAAGIGSVTSAPFTIAGVVVVCPAFEDCTGTLEDQTGTTSATITAFGDPNAVVLTGFFTQDDGIDCAGYAEESPSTLVFDVSTQSREMEVTLSIEIDTNVVVLQACLLSDSQFVPRGGGAPVSQGLLPDCTGVPVPPCVTDRSLGAGAAGITFLIPAGDPKGRG